jgi:excisionase family DNA binding protein
VVHVVPRSAEEGSRRPRVRAVGERLMSVREAAQALGVCTAIVYRLVDSGELGHARISNAIRIAPRDLVAYVIASKKSRERL